MANQQRPRWLRSHFRLLITIDVLAAGFATLFSQVLALGDSTAVLTIRGLDIPYAAAAVLVIPTWLLLLSLAGCYDLGPFGIPESETRRVISASAHLLAVVAVAYYLIHLEQLGRGFVIGIVPSAAAMTLLGRAAARWELNRRLTTRHVARQALLVGPQRSVDELLDHLAAHPNCGVTVAGHLPLNGGDPGDLQAELERVGADLLIVAGATEPGRLRVLTWHLEGSGVDCMVAPAASQLIGPQFNVVPIAGLPLVYVDRGG